MKTHYTTIVIKVKAEEDEINNNDLELSDKIYLIMEELETGFLEDHKEGKFEFTVDVD